MPAAKRLYTGQALIAMMPGSNTLKRQHASIAAATSVSLKARRPVLIASACWGHADLDAAAFAAEVVDVVLDVLVDLPGGLDEGLLHILSRLRRGLPEDQAVVSCKLRTLFIGDLTALQVTLVANEHDHHVGVGVLSSLLQPACQMIKSVTPGDVIHQQSTAGTAIVRPGDGAEGLLSSGIPDLQLDLLVVNSYQPSTKLHADCQIMIGAEALVRELKEQARLADASVANDDILEEVRVGHGASSVDKTASGSFSASPEFR
mmetsp:Transcript_34199/g.55014  ORF Transcript_34199/g.55014 Transcript_34199/m.55014 type:complete len:261 (-) Transcript_34199:62-844(-)